jgi:hypothetical protein
MRLVLMYSYFIDRKWSLRGSDLHKITQIAKGKKKYLNQCESIVHALSSTGAQSENERSRGKLQGGGDV